MAEQDKNKAEVQNLLKEAKDIISEQETNIQKLSKQASEYKAKAEKVSEQIKSAAALGPDIVDQLISQKLITSDRRDVAIQNMANPIKVAQELQRILQIQKVASVGQPDHSKEATMNEDPMKQVDDSYRQSVGLA